MRRWWWVLAAVGGAFFLAVFMSRKYVTFKNRKGKRIWLTRAAYDKYRELQEALHRRDFQGWLIDVEISDGLRLAAEQASLVSGGVSQVKRSAHRLGNAFDVWPYYQDKFIFEPEKQWGKGPAFELWRIIGAEGRNLGLLWGGDWDDDGTPVPQDPDESFFDAAHFELKGGRIGEMLASYPPDEQTDNLA